MNGWGKKLTLMLCAVAATLLVVPSLASACPTLRNVKAFHGFAHMLFDGHATGSDPGSGGTETIALARSITALKLSLTDKFDGRLPAGGGRVIEYIGTARGGDTEVDDTFDNTGTDKSGEVTYGGPVPKGDATLVLMRSTCSFKLHVAFSLVGKYSGDPELDPGRVGGASITDRFPTPPDLHIRGSQAIDDYPACTPVLGYEGSGCGLFGSGWVYDLQDLSQCLSTDTSGCTESDEVPIGHGTMGWNLKPTFKKKN